MERPSDSTTAAMSLSAEFFGAGDLDGAVERRPSGDEQAIHHVSIIGPFPEPEPERWFPEPARLLVEARASERFRKFCARARVVTLREPCLGLLGPCLRGVAIDLVGKLGVRGSTSTRVESSVLVTWRNPPSTTATTQRPSSSWI